MIAKLDEIDYEIIRILLLDSRMSYRNIKNEIGISIGTIHNRIKRLIENKIILNFSLNLNYDKIDIPKIFKIKDSCQNCIHHTVCELYRSLNQKQNFHWNNLLKTFFGIVTNDLSNYCLKYKEEQEDGK